MKKIKYLMLLTLLTISLACYSQIPNRDEMIKRIFTVLKNENEEGFTKLFPDAATLKDFIRKSIKNETPRNERKEINVETFLEGTTDSGLQQKHLNAFRKYIHKGEKKGIDWSNSTFVSYLADSSLSGEEGKEMTKMRGEIYFNVGSKAYFLKFNEIVWFENEGWYGVNLGRIGKKRKLSLNQ